MKMYFIYLIILFQQFLFSKILYNCSIGEKLMLIFIHIHWHKNAFYNYFFIKFSRNDLYKKIHKVICFSLSLHQILSFYYVMENTMLHYPLAQDQTFEDVQNLIFARTKIPIEEQEIFLVDGKEPKKYEMAKNILNQNVRSPYFFFS